MRNGCGRIWSSSTSTCPLRAGSRRSGSSGKTPELGDIPVIVVSGISELAKAKEMIELGGHDYVVKPFTTDTIKRLRKSIESLGFGWKLS